VKKTFILWTAACLLAASCASGGSVATQTSFYQVDVGATTAELEEAMGAPYAKHKAPDGDVEYEYIERLKEGSRNLEVRHYFFLIKDGRVIGKRTRTSVPSPYEFDSYQMQTTQK
jgi:hypothetical protein